MDQQTIIFIIFTRDAFIVTNYFKCNCEKISISIDKSVKCLQMHFFVIQDNFNNIRNSLFLCYLEQCTAFLFF